MRNVQVHSGTDFEITSFAGDHFYVQDRKQAPVVVAAIVKHAARVREGTIPSPPPKAAPEPTFLDGESETEARTHARMHARTQASEPAGKSPNTHVMRLAPSPSSPFPFPFPFPLPPASFSFADEVVRKINLLDILQDDHPEREPPPEACVHEWPEERIRAWFESPA